MLKIEKNKYNYILEEIDNGLFIFKTNCLMMDNDIQHIRENIKKQIDDGILVLNTNVEFVGYIEGVNN